MDSMAAAKSSSVPASGLTTVSVVTMPPGLSGTLTFDLVES
jgi:translation initiation factor eIF-2B subunit delta